MLLEQGGDELRHQLLLFSGQRDGLLEDFLKFADGPGSTSWGDPIMQAPFSSQGLNRYAYVFNDPINLTDPSGFVAASEAIGGSAPAIIGGGIIGGAYLSTLSAPALGASFASALPGIGIAANIGLTLAINPFGGSSGGATYTAGSPGSAPRSVGSNPQTSHATGYSSAPGPAQVQVQVQVQEARPGPAAVQEKADQLQESIEDFDETHDERLARRGPRRGARGAPVPGGGGPVLRPMRGQPDRVAGPLRQVAGTRGLEHSFSRHAEQWFGRPVSISTHLQRWQSLIEPTARSGKQVPWLPLANRRSDTWQESKASSSSPSSTNAARALENWRPRSYPTRANCEVFLSCFHR